MNATQILWLLYFTVPYAVPVLIVLAYIMFTETRQ